MQKKLEEYVVSELKKHKISTVFATVTKHNNASIRFHTNFGYVMVSENKREYLFKYNTNHSDDI